eukprot:1882972-Rhodomonas_salina.1
MDRSCVKANRKMICLRTMVRTVCFLDSEFSRCGECVRAAFLVCVAFNERVTHGQRLGFRKKGRTILMMMPVY